MRVYLRVSKPTAVAQRRRRCSVCVKCVIKPIIICKLIYLPARIMTSSVLFVAAEVVLEDLKCGSKPGWQYWMKPAVSMPWGSCWVSAMFAYIEGPKMDTEHEKRKERKRKL